MLLTIMQLGFHCLVPGQDLLKYNLLLELLSPEILGLEEPEAL